MKRFVLGSLLIFSVAVLAIAMIGGQNATAKDMGLNGVAYVSGHGGHIAIIDLNTMAEPSDIANDRIVISEAGTEMEGIIAGMQFEEVKKAGGSHGGALTKNKDKLVVGLLNGNVVVYDMKNKTKSEPMKVGQKFCDAIAGPDGNIYLEDMADGNVYVFDPKGMKTVEKIPVGAAVCGIAWTRNNKKAYVSDMPQGIVFVLDWKTKKVIKEIKDPEMTFIHQIRMTNDGKELWVAAANEFDPGLKPGTHDAQIVVIDTAKDEVIDHIKLPDNVRPHDIEFSPDGKTAVLAARTYEADSVLALMDVKSKKLDKQVSACYSCHSKYGIIVKIDAGSPLLCGVEVDWK